MAICLKETLGSVPPIIIEPEAESDEADRSRDMRRSVDTSARPRSRSPLRYLHRQSNGTSTISSLVSPTLATVQDPASVGTLYEVKVIHDWASDLMKVTKDIVKKMGHTEVFSPVNRAPRTQKLCSHFAVPAGA